MSKGFTDEAVRHGLAHLEIGSPAIQATIVEQRFVPEALSRFFVVLRGGHQEVLRQHAERMGTPSLATVISSAEHQELDGLGPYGQFAGCMALHENGLTVVESVLHEISTPALQVELQASLAAAVNELRG
jgi:hypothetical protein